MRIQTATFLKSAGQPDQFPRGSWPEIAFVGRSNVGKSSLLNRLLGRRKLAHTSSTPGRTRTINFYEVNGACLFVDLPGYGYAKVSRDLQESWWALVEDYLVSRPQLRGVVHLMDARHPPTPDDQALQAFLRSVAMSSLVVLTKADKVGRGERRAAQASAWKVLGLDAGAPTAFVSAETGEGIPAVWRTLEAWLEAPARFEPSGAPCP
jgi:GTP-binding protein